MHSSSSHCAPHQASGVQDAAFRIRMCHGTWWVGLADVLTRSTDHRLQCAASMPGMTTETRTHTHTHHSGYSQTKRRKVALQQNTRSCKPRAHESRKARNAKPLKLLTTGPNACAANKRVSSSSKQLCVRTASPASNARCSQTKPSQGTSANLQMGAQ